MFKYFYNEDGSFKAARDEKGHFVKRDVALAALEAERASTAVGRNFTYRALGRRGRFGLRR